MNITQLEKEIIRVLKINENVDWDFSDIPPKKEFKELLGKVKIEKTISGGSVANSIVGLSQLGNEVGFIGKVNEDELGNQYEIGLKGENVKFFYNKKK